MRVLARISAALLLVVAWSGLAPSTRSDRRVPDRRFLAISGDIDRDGFSDSVSVSAGALTVDLSTAPPVLLSEARAEVVGVAISDIDWDGDSDVISLSAQGHLDLWRNDGVGRFAHAQTARRPDALRLVPQGQVTPVFVQLPPFVASNGHPDTEAVFPSWWSFSERDVALHQPSSIALSERVSASLPSRAPPAFLPV